MLVANPIVMLTDVPGSHLLCREPAYNLHSFGELRGVGHMRWWDYLICSWIALFIVSVCVIELLGQDKVRGSPWLSVIATSFVAISLLAILAVSFTPHGS